MGKDIDILWNYLYKGELQLLKEALDNLEVNINDTDRVGSNILHRYALEVNNLNFNIEEVVNLFIEHGIDINAKRKLAGDELTALHIAVVRMSYELCKVLLNKGAQIDEREKHGNTPLWLAAMNYRGREEMGRIIKLLFEHGANPNIENETGNSPLDVAKKLKGSDLIQFFVK
ncbi:MAG: ankyrin repeat domain-containing protein [Bacteroidota bacterium]